MSNSTSPLPLEKTCTKCKESKLSTVDNYRLVTEFRSSSKYTYLKSICKECEKREIKKYNVTYLTREKRDSINEKQRSQYDPVKNRTLTLARKYKLTVEEYNKLLEAQGGVCKICKQPPSGMHRTGVPNVLVVDHDHVTKQVRGLLCSACNVALGSFKDEILFLENAILYLKENNHL